ncbi:hypothetical protein ZOSMA_44G01440 [Zostera marina]|uniref:RNA exonuclease 4 n=1 Tax=Zostera marina TaxID=29655 RepID=A0A0K9P110_ZOSMR|nr:hypothetical protein ZOSMA_44G01440 [Zostera marina]
MSQVEIFDQVMMGITNCCREVVAIDCEMVGGGPEGSDGSVDLCARVCMINENEKVIFHSFVKPQLPIKNYRSEITGLTESYLAEATPLSLIKHTVEKILYNGERISLACLNSGQPMILVGHGLDHDLECLKIDYPRHLLRDTSIYPPLMKTNSVSHSLKYLTKTYLGYEIQTGIHDPYEDCVASLRIYKRMRDQLHKIETGYKLNSRYNSDNHNSNNAFFTQLCLEEKSPDALLEMSWFGLQVLVLGYKG